MANEPTARDAALRRLLVSQASRRSARRPVTRVLAATAGSVAAVAALATVVVLVAQPSAFTGFAQQRNEPYAFGTPSFVHDDETILGEPLEFRSQESQTIDLGTPPRGATALGMALRCFAAGSYSVSAVDEWPAPLNCDDDGRVISGAMGYYIRFPSTGETRVRISASPGGEYAIWLAWVAVPPDPDPSAEQSAALADGVVTREEYVAGFDRYAACLLEAGYVIDANRTSEVIMAAVGDDAVSSGVDRQCYVAEFRAIDMQWQAEHPQMSLDQQRALVDGEVTRDEYLAGFDRYAACLADLGATVTTAEPDAEVLDFTVEASPDVSEQAGRCYRFEFFTLDMAWRQAHGG